ncbi:serine/threonine protein kinase [Mangrovivirga cuniculi]|uniref:Protein kinase domain-containing protein n=1 Tax=Mangrovivirga cuniculi TaxID=2715131 RepID=A0A4D7JSG0_9BACT|nr:serine/threonine-protein kinase [Mangrovivirga cuniculi]QCK15622.1 hypothetical protein DCC35_13140 [Mangrovivirga cuniculi]
MYTINQIEDWYNRALEKQEEIRESFLKKELENDPKLLTAVLDLLQFEKVEKSALTRLVEQLNQPEIPQEIPKIERYEIIEKVGEGGMAVVYKAKRIDGVFDHNVAIKILKKGMDSEDILRRFTLERNLLGRLKHQHIAQIYDGGLTTDGRPYFVMEYVDGTDVLTYVQGKSKKEKLNFFLQICSAVEFAHQNLVIHRDIKPNNILVNQLGELKLTDFGIAKVIADENPEYTKPHNRLLTPDYASPEQIEGIPVDLRSDIYQLGKILQKLFVSSPPKEIKTIYNQATSPDRHRRYGSVSELRGDIERYLERKPIIARKPSLGYHLSLFVKRNKIPVTIAVIAFILISILSIIYISSLKEAQLEAERKERKAEEALVFLVDLFNQSDPTVNLGDSLNIGTLLQEGMAKAGQIQDPSTKAAILATLGKVNASLGKYKEGEILLNQSLIIYKDLEDKQATSQVYYEKGMIKKRTADNPEALILLKKALQLSDEVEEKIKIKIHLAEIFDLFDNDSARYYSEQALADMANAKINRKLEIQNRYNITEIGLGLLNNQQTDSVMDYKIALVREFKAKYPEETLQLAQFYSNLSVNYRWENEYDSALKYARLNLDLLNKVYGKNNINTTSGLLLMAEGHSWKGHSDSAKFYSSKSLEIKENLFGKNHPSQIEELSLIAKNQINNGEYKKGEIILRQVYELSYNTYGLYNKITGDHLFNLLQHYNRMGDFKKSVLLYPRLIKVDSSTYGMTSNTATTFLDYAWALGSLDSTQKALNNCYRAREIYKKDVGKDHFLYGMALFNIGEYGRESMPEKSLLYLDSAINILEKKMPDNHPRVGNYMHTYAEALRENEQDSLSNIYYVKSIKNYSTNYSKDEPDRVVAFQINYSRHLLNQNMTDSARTVLQEAFILIDDHDQSELQNEISTLMNSI